MQKEPPSPTPFSPEDDRARENTLNATLSKFTDFSGRGKEGAGFSPRNQLRGFSPLGVRSFYPNPHTFNNLTRNIPRGSHPMYNECRHIFTSGKRCQSPAL